MDGEAGGEEEGRARQSLQGQETPAAQVLQRTWRRRPSSSDQEASVVWSGLSSQIR